MVHLNLFHNRVRDPMPIFFIFFLLFYSTLSAQEMESPHENRFSLFPPTEDEKKVIVDFIHSFFGKITTHAIPDAYFNQTSHQFQAVTSLENFTTFVQPLMGVDVSEKLVSGNVAFTSNDKKTATFFVIFKTKEKGRSLRVEFKLENQDDDWKIMSIKIYKI